MTPTTMNQTTDPRYTPCPLATEFTRDVTGADCALVSRD